MNGTQGEQPPGGSFEQRLRIARDRQGLDRPAADSSRTAASPGGSAMSMGLRVGVELVSALAVAVAIGWGLDRWLHTMPIFIGIFVLLGGAAGVANVWRVLGRTSPSRK